MRPAALAAALAACAAVALSASCARILEARSLRVRPLEKPQETTVERGVGAKLHGKREGDSVHIRVIGVRRCETHTHQRAEGFERTTRTPLGHTLAIQWAMGGLFTLGGAGVAAWQWTHPPLPDADGAVAPDRSRGVWLQAGLVSAIGLGLLVGSIVQQASLGVHERPLGVRQLERKGPLRDCGPAPAPAGAVRLTLPDGAPLVAALDAEGRAVLALPADIEDRLRETDRRATLELLGDWRSQTRIAL